MSSFDKIKNFLSEVRAESKKVTWPKPAELKESTIVVIVSVFIITLFVSIVDLILSKGLDILLRLGT